MTLTSTSDLYVAELAIYLILLPLTAYLGWRHGQRGLLGYFYLNAFCIVRIVADIVSILPANQHATHPKTSTAVLSSVGLSPIMLALGGFIHEAHVYLVEAKHSTQQAAKVKRWLWVAQFHIHTVAILGMVLVIIGSIDLVASKEPLTTSEVNHGDKLRSVGAALLLVLWVALSQYALYLFYVARKTPTSSSGSVAVSRLVSGIVAAIPFLGLRSIYSLLYTLDHKDSKLNPITGALWVKVVFVVLAPLGAVIGMSIGGWLSRDVAAKKSFDRCKDSENVTDKTIRVAYEEVRVSES